MDSRLSIHGRAPLLDYLGDTGNRYEEAIMAAVDRVELPETRAELAYRILSSGIMRNPRFASWATERWARDMATMRGIDDHTDGYLTEFTALAEKTLAEVSLAQAAGMLTRLLNGVEAQQHVSYAVKNLLVTKALRSSNSLASGILSSMGDLFLENIADTVKAPEEVLRFLTSSPSNGSSQEFVGFFEQEFNLGSRKVFGRLTQTVGGMGSYELAPEAIRIRYANEMHQSFWSLPFELHTLYLSRVLFPVGDKDAGRFDRSMIYVLDKTLPLSKPYAKEARELLACYVEGCSEPLKRLVFSALVSASAPGSSQNHDLRPGEVLALVLGRTGAAGAKLLQSVHSYLSSMSLEAGSDLAQLRDDISSAKGMHAPPFRWEIFERIEAALPGENRSTISHVGTLKGSGAYGFTVEAFRGAHTSAITLLREGLQDDAEYQFERLEESAVRLAARNPNWTPLIGIVRHAKRMSHIETDFEIGARQIEEAERIYNGIVVRVDGFTFRFHTAKLLTFGSQFKETELIPGEHFNALPENTEEERKYKHAAARALMIVELYALLRGGPFDHDRYGGQQRAHGETIGLFDHGALDLDQPSRAARRTLGRILGEALLHSSRGNTSFAESFSEEVRRLGEGDSTTVAYLRSFQRATLALGDFGRYLSGREVNSLLAELNRQGAVDPNILLGLIGSRGIAAPASGQQAPARAFGAHITLPQLSSWARARGAVLELATTVAGYFRFGFQ